VPCERLFPAKAGDAETTCRLLARLGIDEAGKLVLALRPDRLDDDAGVFPASDHNDSGAHR
jgi:hypothetical protein